jgi:hypothetical protein
MESYPAFSGSLFVCQRLYVPEALTVTQIIKEPELISLTNSFSGDQAIHRNLPILVTNELVKLEMRMQELAVPLSWPSTILL